MTVEDRLQLVIGRQAFTIAMLETEVERLQAELAKKEKEPEKPE